MDDLTAHERAVAMKLLLMIQKEMSLQEVTEIVDAKTDEEIKAGFVSNGNQEEPAEETVEETESQEEEIDLYALAKKLGIEDYDKYLQTTQEQAAAYGAKKATTQDIFANCQTISNHVADLPATKGMFGKELFSLMKSNATFINTGRGAQVVEEDLIAVLKENPDMTAILDVTFPEPPVAGSELYTLPNVFLTPHIAGSSGDERQRMSAYMVEEFYRWREGQPCKWEVTEKMLEIMA